MEAGKLVEQSDIENEDLMDFTPQINQSGYLGSVVVNDDRLDGDSNDPKTPSSNQSHLTATDGSRAIVGKEPPKKKYLTSNGTRTSEYQQIIEKWKSVAQHSDEAVHLLKTANKNNLGHVNGSTDNWKKSDLQNNGQEDKNENGRKCVSGAYQEVIDSWKKKGIFNSEAALNLSVNTAAEDQKYLGRSLHQYGLGPTFQSTPNRPRGRPPSSKSEKKEKVAGEPGSIDKAMDKVLASQFGYIRPYVVLRKQEDGSARCRMADSKSFRCARTRNLSFRSSQNISINHVEESPDELETCARVRGSDDFCVAARTHPHPNHRTYIYFTAFVN